MPPGPAITTATLFPLVPILGGLLVLIAGGEFLVRGAAALAVSARINPLIIGLTVVAFGTSAPEFAVTIRSALDGSADLALGNVVGSNIGNTLLILGASALVAPLNVASHLVRFYIPVMIAASFLLYFMALDGVIGRLDGLALCIGLIMYNVGSARRTDVEEAPVQAEFAESAPPADTTLVQVLLHVAGVLAGLVLLVVGARWIVQGAVALSRGFGVPELVVGLTIVAVGTSLPELATSLTASYRGHRDIAVGNVVGSNLFNILGVLGLAAVLASGGVPVSREALELDLPFMIATAAATLSVVLTGKGIGRAEGGFFVAYYLAYAAYLVLEAARPEAPRTLPVLLGGFVAPLSVMALAVTWRRWSRARRPGPGAEESP